MLDILSSQPQRGAFFLASAFFVITSKIARLVAAEGKMEMWLSMIAIIASLALVHEGCSAKVSKPVAELEFDLTTADDGHVINHFAEAGSYSWDIKGSGGIILTAANFARLLMKTHTERELSERSFKNERLQIADAKRALRVEEDRSERARLEADRECEQRCRKLSDKAQKDAAWTTGERYRVEVMSQYARIDLKNLKRQVKEYEDLLATLEKRTKAAQEKSKLVDQSGSSESEPVAAGQEVRATASQMVDVAVETSNEDYVKRKLVFTASRMRTCLTHIKTNSHPVRQTLLDLNSRREDLRRPERVIRRAVRQAHRVRTPSVWQDMRMALQDIDEGPVGGQSPAVLPEILVGPRPAAIKPAHSEATSRWTAWRRPKDQKSLQQSLARRMREEGLPQIEIQKEPRRAIFPVPSILHDIAMAAPAPMNDVTMQAVDVVRTYLPPVQSLGPIVQGVELAPEDENVQMTGPPPSVAAFTQRNLQMAYPPLQFGHFGQSNAFGPAYPPTRAALPQAIEAVASVQQYGQVELPPIHATQETAAYTSVIIPQQNLSGPQVEEEMRGVDEDSKPQYPATQLQQTPFTTAQKGKWRPTVERVMEDTQDARQYMHMPLTDAAMSDHTTEDVVGWRGIETQTSDAAQAGPSNVAQHSQADVCTFSALPNGSTQALEAVSHMTEPILAIPNDHVEAAPETSEAVDFSLLGEFSTDSFTNQQFDSVTSTQSIPADPVSTESAAVSEPTKFTFGHVTSLGQTSSLVKGGGQAGCTISQIPIAKYTAAAKTNAAITSSVTFGNATEDDRTTEKTLDAATALPFSFTGFKTQAHTSLRPPLNLSNPDEPGGAGVSFSFGTSTARSNTLPAAYTSLGLPVSIPTFKVAPTAREQKDAANRAAAAAAAKQTFKSEADLAWEAELLAEEQEQERERLEWQAATQASAENPTAGGTAATGPMPTKPMLGLDFGCMSGGMANPPPPVPIVVGRGNKAARRM